MRDIKFRGMDLEGRWFYGLPCIIKDGRDKGTYISNKVGIPKAYEVRPETLSQFTGLVDKQGVEIYEGDIVRVLGDVASVFYIDVNCAFYYQKPNGHIQPLGDFGSTAYIVIGNIYENIDLL